MLQGISQHSSLFWLECWHTCQAWWKCMAERFLEIYAALWSNKPRVPMFTDHTVSVCVFMCEDYKLIRVKIQTAPNMNLTACEKPGWMIDGELIYRPPHISSTRLQKCVLSAAVNAGDASTRFVQYFFLQQQHFLVRNCFKVNMTLTMDPVSYWLCAQLFFFQVQ